MPDGTPAKEPPNKELDLSILDAAQSVPRPLCLLSGIAAQLHVGPAEQPLHREGNRSDCKHRRAELPIHSMTTPYVVA